MSTPQTKLRYYTAEEYLAMERASEEKHEYLDGVIYDMAGELPPHGRISVNLIGELYAQLKGTQCELFAKDTKVRSGPDPRPIWPPKDLFSYPDILVLCGKGEYHDHYQDVLLNPKVIIEVLSKGTAGYDQTEKFRRYRTYLPSLTDYILVSQTESVIEHYRRQSSGDWLLSTREGLDAKLQIESIGCTVKLGDVYARVEFGALQPEENHAQDSTGEPDQQ
jgi:Uma2 family endonuclease